MARRPHSPEPVVRAGDRPTYPDRRRALQALGGAAALLLGGAGLARAEHLATGVRRAPPDHPTPRRGITAERVLTPAQLREHGAGDAEIAAFDEVRQIPHLVDGIRCHCGCAGRPGHYSLLSCYEGEGMASHCAICRGEGRMAFRLSREGHSLDAIREAIDARYG